jgi:hypothetical protein
MRAYVRVRAPDGSHHELVHGDLVGRLSTAALPIDDARISEAHAMISLRERELKLIRLRGGLAFDGKPVNELTLRPGLEVVLAAGISLHVESLHLPSSVLGLVGERLARQVLPPVASLVPASEGVRLQAGYVQDAVAWVWCTGSAWRVRIGERVTSLAPGDRFEVGGETIDAVEVPLEAAGGAATRAVGGVEAPLRIEANFDTVQIHREGAAALVLGGTHARIVSELVALAGPAHWKVIAGLLWPDAAEPESLRSRFDVALSRLRRKLREARIRTDLVHTDGAGQVELLLYPHDRVADRT